MLKPMYPQRKNAAALDPAPLLPVEHYFAGLNEVLRKVPFVEINRAVEVLLAAHREQRTIFLFGNGGSASLASHLACDLNKGTISNKTHRLRVLALTDNVPLLTAWANDSCYEDIFAEQMRNFVRPGDVAFAISGSGNSPNVLKALGAARDAGAFTIVLTGYRGGRAAGLSDLAIIVPSEDMQHIEDLHLTIAHSLFRSVREAITLPQQRASAAGLS